MSETRALVATIPLPGLGEDPTGELRVVVHFPLTVDALAGVADLVKAIQESLPDRLFQPLKVSPSSVEGVLELLDAGLGLKSFTSPDSAAQPHHWIRTELFPALERVRRVVDADLDEREARARDERREALAEGLTGFPPQEPGP